MAMVGVDSSSLYRRTHSLSRLARSWVGGRLAPSTFIKWTGWTLAMALPWWQHHKHCCGYYYYLLFYIVFLSPPSWRWWSVLFICESFCHSVSTITATVMSHFHWNLLLWLGVLIGRCCQLLVVTRCCMWIPLPSPLQNKRFCEHFLYT